MSRFHHKKGKKMKIKLVAVAVAMFLSISGASAEISTKVFSVKGDAFKLPSGTECFVKERGLLFDGAESSVSGLFEEAGLAVSKEKKSDCVLVVGASISVQHKNNPTSTVVSKLVNENDVMEEVNNFAETDTQDDPKSVLGETTGASVGATFGLAGAAVGTMVGSIADSRPSKFISCDAAGIRVGVEYKDAQGKKAVMEIQVIAKAEPFDRPISVLRAAVKRVVAEIQTQPEAATNASASAPAEIPPQEVH